MAGWSKDNQVLWLWNYEGKSGLPLVATRFFNGIRFDDFVQSIDLMLQHQNVYTAEDVMGCCFEENFDPIEDYPFPGVRIHYQVSNRDAFESATMTFEKFVEFLLIACRAFVAVMPEKRDELIEVLEKHNLKLE